MADQPSALDQLSAAEDAEKQQLSAIRGQYATGNEQAGYQQTIDKHRANGGSATDPAYNTQLKDTLADVGSRTVDAVKGAWNGIPNAVAETMVGYDWAVTHLTGSSDDQVSRFGGVSHNQVAADVRAKANSFKFDRSDSTVLGDVTSGIAQFVTGMLAGTSEAKLVGLSGKTAGYVGSVATMATSFNPNDPRLANLIASFPALAPLIPDFLKSDPNKSEGENRLAAGFEGLGFNIAEGAGHALFSWLRGARAVGQAVEDAKGIAAAKPIPVEPAAPAAEPRGNADTMLEEFNQNPDHPTQMGTKQVGNTSVELSKDPFDANTVHVESIRADQPGQGAGTQAMQQLTQLADKHGVKLTLDAVPLKPAEGEAAIPAEKLQDFYKSQGFNSTEGGLVEGRAMVREPTAPQAWTPPDVAGEKTPEPKPAADTSKPTFDPKAIAMKALTPVSKEQAQAVLGALHDGKYMDMPAMLDDTHRTIPWDQLADGANLKGLFNAFEDTMGGLIKQAHGTGVVPREQVQQLAAALGGNVDVLNRLYEGVTGEGGLAARLTAGTNILVASARRLKELAVNARALDAETPEGAQALADFQKQVTLHSAIVGQVRQSQAEVGRALWSMRYLKASSNVTLTDLREYAGTTFGADALKKLANQVATGGLADATNVADAISGKGWTNVLREIAQNGMLSAPTTQVTNIIGNVGNALLKVGERYVAAGIGAAQRILVPNSQAASFREAWAHTMGAYDGLKNGWQLAWQAMKDENFTSKFTTPTSRAIELNPAGRVGLDATYAQVVNAVGTLIRWPGRFMGLFDHFTQSIGYQGDLSARSYVQAAQEADAKGLADDARDAFMAKRQAQLKANPTAEIEQQAMAAGKYSAFLEDPQTKFGAGLSKALNSAPILKLLVAPFIHRPGNMLRQGIADYTLLGPALFQGSRDALAAGGSDTSLALARMFIGTSTLLSSYELAANGSLVGQRRGTKNTESLDQVQPYSVKLGNSWYKYDRLDPIGLWLGLGADLHEAIQNHYDPSDPDSTHSLTLMSTAAAQAVAHVAMDKSFMKSVNDFMEAATAKDPARADVMATKLIGDNLAKLLPFSGLARSISHGTDDSGRVTSGGIFDALKGSIPYLSQDLPPRRDLLGRPVQPQSWWNPFNGAPAAPDQMDQELSKLAINITLPTRSINGYTLDSKEYDKVLTLATQTPMFGGGRNLEAFLRDQTASDAWKQNASANDGGLMRNGGLVQSAIDKAYSTAKDMYMFQHQDFIDKKRADMQNKFLQSIPNATQPAAASAQ